MTWERTFDVSLIESFLFDPQFFEYIKDDSFDRDSFEVNPLSDIFIVKWEGSRAAAMGILHGDPSAYEIHFMVKKKYTKQAVDYSTSALLWAQNTLKCNKFIAYIPKKYRHVAWLCLRSGFKRYKTDQTVTKNGVVLEMNKFIYEV